MAKRGYQVIVLVLVLVLLLAVFAACGEKEHTVTLMVDGVVVDTYAVTDNDKLIEPEKPANEGFTFNGWFLLLPSNEVHDTPYKFGGAVTEDITLVAGFTKCNYTATFVSGSNEWTEKVEHGDKLSEPRNITNNGYQLTGWQATASDEVTKKPFNFDTPIIGDVTISAEWIAIEYGITYHLNGGENNSKNPTKYTILSEKVEFLAPTRTGYTFAGWYSDEEFTNVIDKISGGSTGELSLYAKWVANSYTIIFSSNGGEEVPAIMVTFGEQYSLPTATKIGSIFANWSHNGKLFSSTGVWNIPENITITAVYTADVYTVSYDAAGGKNIAPFNVSLGENYTLPNAEKVGYTFVAWENGDEVVPNSGKWQYTSDVTLTAQYTANKYTITFDANGGETITDLIVTYDQPYTLSSAVKTGYTFDNWNNDNALFPSSGIWTTTSDITLTAKYTANKYTITFDANGGENIDNINVQYDSAVNLSDAVRRGYKFNYWTLNGEQLTGDVWKITCDITLVADYSLIDYSITYNNAVGTEHSNPSSYTVEDAAITFADAERDGYTFEGWFSDAQFENACNGIETGSIGAVSVYAKWTANEYFVTLKDNNGDGFSSVLVVVFGSPYSFDDAEKEGHTFSCWTYNNAEIASSGTWQIARDVTIVAKYVADGCLVTFVSGGANVDTANATFGEPFVFENTATKAGYSFVGWKLNDAIFESGDTWLTAENASLIAYFQPINYTITYNLAGNADEITNNNPTTYNIEDSNITLTSAEQVGYTFAGWYSDSTFETRVTTIVSGSTGNIKLYAKWSTDDYTITYENVTNATNSNPTTYNIDSDNIALTNPEQEGYTFSGWYSDETLTQSVTTIPSGTTGNIELYAKWSTDDYSITYNNVTNATNNNPTTYNIDSDNIALTNAEREGYTFAGWYSDEVLTQLVTAIPNGSTGNINLYAKWSTDDYSITYNNVTNATNNNPTTYNIDSDNIALTNAEREGYTFAGWYSDEVLTQLVTAIPNGSTGNINLYAKWSIINYSITYNLAGSADEITNNNPTTYNIDSDNITLTNAEQVGYTFAGWYSDEALTKSVTTIPSGTTGNTELFAKWSIINYSITYNLAGSVDEITNNNPTTYNIDSDSITLTNAEQVGYTFAGWYSDEVLTQLVTAIPNGSTGNINLYAKWSIINYTITYNLAGNADEITNNNPSDYTINSEDITLTNAEQEGYTFAGWYSDEALTKLVTTIPNGSTGNINLYAKWSAINYTITYNLAGNADEITNNNPASYTINSEDIILTNAEQEGYTFAGWYSDSDFETRVTTIVSGTTGNIELFAKWSTDDYTITYENVTNATNSNPVTYNIEDNDITLTNAEQEGYTFAGWYSDETLTQLVTIIPSGSTGNIELFAKWSVINYTITYNLAGSADEITNNNPVTYNIEDSNITLTSAEQVGYTFAGWYSDEALTKSITTIPSGTTGNITLYANWQTIYYTATYLLSAYDSASPYETCQVAHGETLTAPEDPTNAQSNQVFDSWHLLLADGSLSTNAFDFAGIINCDITLVATFTIQLSELNMNGSDDLEYYMTGKATLKEKGAGEVLLSDCQLHNLDVKSICATSGIGENRVVTPIALQLSRQITDSELTIIEQYLGNNYEAASNILYITDAHYLPLIDAMKQTVVVVDNVFYSQDMTTLLYVNSTSLTLPSQLTTIKPYSRIDNATEITLGENTNFVFENGILYSSDHSQLIWACQSNDLSETLIVPSTVTSIGAYAFSYNANLMSIVLPDGLITIGEGAFYNCQSLVGTVVIPLSVTNVGSKAFYACRSLELIAVTNTSDSAEVLCWSEDWNSMANLDTFQITYASIMGSEGNWNYTLSTADNTVEITAYTGEETDIIVPSTIAGGTVVGIGSNVFNNMTAVISVTLPQTIISIGEYAFSNTSIVAINLPDSLVTIGDYAFADIDPLLSVVFPSSVVTIGNYAFKQDFSRSSLQFIDFAADSELITIGGYAFKGCLCLEDFTFPTSLRHIGNNAFEGCDSLANIILPEGLTSIGSNVYAGCDYISAFYLPSTLAEIGDSAFAGKPMATIYTPLLAVKALWSPNWNSRGLLVNWGGINNTISGTYTHGTAQYTFTLTYQATFDEDTGEVVAVVFVTTYVMCASATMSEPTHIYGHAVV